MVDIQKSSSAINHSFICFLNPDSSQMKMCPEHLHKYLWHICKCAEIFPEAELLKSSRFLSILSAALQSF